MVTIIKKIIWALISSFLLLPQVNFAEPVDTLNNPCMMPHTSFSTSLTNDTIAKQLGWITSNENRCGGYYLEHSFPIIGDLSHKDRIHISSHQMTLSRHGTSIGEGKVTISRFEQEIIANKAYVYHDPITGKLSAIDLVNHITLREPSNLIIAQCGHFDIKTKMQSLRNILYRAAIYNNNKQTLTANNQLLQKENKIYQLTAWGQAEEFYQNQPKIYEFVEASYSTCPPTSTAWQLKASQIELNQNSGRGTAKHARLLVKGIPVLYTPYFNFPIDQRRQTGFLWPAFGIISKSGPYLATPFYWNMAPNYDMTITPNYLSNRGLQLTDLGRYLTSSRQGKIKISILPNDQLFSTFKETQQTTHQSSADPMIQAELRRLKNASITRKSFFWQDDTRFNEHWSSKIDYNYVSDDYYLKDLNGGLNTFTSNQLLQQAELYYHGQYWNFLGRVQGYQTLHPINEPTVQNQYARFPQLVLEGDYPGNRTGIDYFITNDFSHFDIRNTPGDNSKLPMGNRINIQPGISIPFTYPAFYVTPRLQFAMTQYDIGHINEHDSSTPQRTIPIFDINSGLYFDRNLTVLNHPFRQTLEPQIYYTYVPYRNQSALPIFDTSVNILTFDQLFTYNRFSGLDRIGDANQISAGISTRFIDEQSGFEKIRAGIGEIFYFKRRKVTLCNDSSCIDNPDTRDNYYNQSPIAGLLKYNLTPYWSLSSDTLLRLKKWKFNNETITVHYQQDRQRIMNFSYTFVRTKSNAENLSQTAVSFAWPIVRDWRGVTQWTQNWNHFSLQNILFGLQYDSCCWAVRFVAGRGSTSINFNKTPQYDNAFYMQFALKGLGEIGSADPSQLLNNSIVGYKSNFGQDF